MWVVVLVADKDAFNSAAHAMEGVVILKAGEAGVNRRILFRLRCLGCEVIIGQWIQAEGLWLVSIEW